MKKLKIYVDTSVISYLEEDGILDKREDTRKLWETFSLGRYEVVISPIVIAELEECPEPKRTALFSQLQRIEFIELLETEEVLNLADKYFAAGLLPVKCNDDRQHIAYACVYNCDMIVSWNFKHLVNYNTISGVKSVNAQFGYREMPIYSPTMLVEGGENDDS